MLISTKLWGLRIFLGLLGPELLQGYRVLPSALRANLATPINCVGGVKKHYQKYYKKSSACSQEKRYQENNSQYCKLLASGSLRLRLCPPLVLTVWTMNFQQIPYRLPALQPLKSGIPMSFPSSSFTHRSSASWKRSADNTLFRQLTLVSTDR